MIDLHFHQIFYFHPIKTEFQQQLSYFFGHPFTTDQEIAAQGLESFLKSQNSRSLFILKGFAGTGKTSLLAALIKTIENYQVETLLMAPTGRAAKVLGGKANKQAYTIHKVIYRSKSKVDAHVGIELNHNIYKRTIFIVDEASMISDFAMDKSGNLQTRNLLDDLFEFVYSGKNNRLIILGDSGQLPPVGATTSPALDETYLKYHYPTLEISGCTLKQVLRQAENSLLLENATRMRQSDENEIVPIRHRTGSSVQLLEGHEAIETLESAYQQFGMDETLVITRSNKLANQYNQHIRNRILWHEEELAANDLIMAVKNNYYWIDGHSSMGFIANGEQLRVRRFYKQEDLYGFKFGHITIDFPDYPELDEMDVIVHLESLYSEEPNLSRNRMKELFFEVEKDYAFMANKKERYDAILKDKYFNALQIKFSYAVTCHKSQGGQWHTVFIDPGYLPEGATDSQFNRWLYTALTRAKSQVYLMNFEDEMLESLNK